MLDPNKSIILFCPRRSGSTLTLQLLSHVFPTHVNLQELFSLSINIEEINGELSTSWNLDNRVAPGNYRQIIHSRLQKLQVMKAPVILKITADLVDYSPILISELLLSNKYQIITLNRLDRYKSTKSMMFALITNQWTSTHKLEKNLVYFNTTDLKMIDTLALHIQSISVFDKWNDELNRRSLVFANLHYEEFETNISNLCKLLSCILPANSKQLLLNFITDYKKQSISGVKLINPEKFEQFWITYKFMITNK